MDIEYAKKILDETKGNYNLISEDFSRTRNKFWEEMSFISGYAGKGDKILDLGCGNGRLSEIFRGNAVDYYGVDFSDKLIEIARKRYPQLRFQTADALNLPFPDNFSIRYFL
jgi:ubiquinone/menaquinone biosynthesis C-methylase UbiE